MNKITLQRHHYKMLEQRITDRYPDVKIKYKEHHWFWRHLPKSLRHSGTTLNKTIWMPFNNCDFRMLAHEYQHEVDIQNMGFLSFLRMYFSPQIFALFWFAFATIALGFSLPWFAIVMACIGAVFLLPWPSKSRTFLEMRGYLMTIYIGWETNTHNTHLVVDALRSWLYYKMIWTRLHAQYIVNESIQELDHDISSIGIAFQDVYEIIHIPRPAIL